MCGALVRRSKYPTTGPFPVVKIYPCMMVDKMQNIVSKLTKMIKRN